MKTYTKIFPAKLSENWSKAPIDIPIVDKYFTQLRSAPEKLLRSYLIFFGDVINMLEELVAAQRKRDKLGEENGSTAEIAQARDEVTNRIEALEDWEYSFYLYLYYLFGCDIWAKTKKIELTPLNKCMCNTKVDGRHIIDDAYIISLFNTGLCDETSDIIYVFSAQVSQLQETMLTLHKSSRKLTYNIPVVLSAMIRIFYSVEWLGRYMIYLQQLINHFGGEPKNDQNSEKHAEVHAASSAAVAPILS